MATHIFCETVPMRLDRYLRTLDSKLTQGLVQKLLRKKYVVLNGTKVDASTLLTMGDCLTLPDWIGGVAADTPKIQPWHERFLAQRVIYQDADIVAIDKPSGMATQGGTKVVESVDSVAQSYGMRLVHRLDKGTSGVLLLAKSRQSAVALTNAFAQGAITKEYVAITEGVPTQAHGSIQTGICKQTGTLGGYCICELGTGLFASTQYEVAEISPPLAMLRFFPKTGRTHQLRLHAGIICGPIVGDTRYGSSSRTRLMLHAVKVHIPHTVLGGSIEIHAPLPTTFMEYMS